MTIPTDDAFATGLRRLYGIERDLVTELDILASDVSIDALDDLDETGCRERLEDLIDVHREETIEQLERLESVFGVVGEEPVGDESPELDGWNADKEQFNNIVLNDELRPLYYLDAAKTLEELERSAYEPVLATAEALEAEGDLEDALEPLERNQAEEVEMLEALDSLAADEATTGLREAVRVDPGNRTALDRSATRARSINLEMLEDVFLYQLWNAYYVAQRLPALLTDLSTDVERDDLAAALEDHRDRTRERAERLDGVFDRLGPEATGSRNRTFDGVVASGYERLEAGDGDAAHLVALETGRATGRVERRRYEELRTMAERIGFPDAVVDPLTETLEEERTFVDALEECAYEDLLAESTADAAE